MKLPDTMQLIDRPLVFSGVLSLLLLMVALCMNLAYCGWFIIFIHLYHLRESILAPRFVSIDYRNTIFTCDHSPGICGDQLLFYV